MNSYNRSQRDLNSVGSWRTTGGGNRNKVSPFINENENLVLPKSTFVVNPAFEQLSDDFLDTTYIGARRGLYDKTENQRGLNARSSSRPSTPKNPTTRSSQGRWFARNDSDVYKEVIRLKRRFCVMVTMLGLLSLGSLLVTVLLIFGKITGRCCELQGPITSPLKQSSNEDFDKALQDITRNISSLKDLINDNTERSKEVALLKTKIEEVEKKYEALTNKMNLFIQNHTTISQSLKQCCDETKDSIVVLERKLNTTTAERKTADLAMLGLLGKINMSLTEQISNVSKMEGPIGPQGFNGSQGPIGLQGLQGIQGPQGPKGYNGSRGPQGIQGIQGPQGLVGPPGSSASGGANFSYCQYKLVTSTPVTSNSLAETDALMKEPADKKFFGVVCSTNAAEEYNLVTLTDAAGRRVYRCLCKGQSSKFTSATGQMYCYLHYWECPLG